MILSQANLDALRVQFSMVFEKAYGETPIFYDQLATTIPSTTASNQYGWLAKQITLKKWAGERVAQNLSEHSHIVVNQKFEGTVEVDRDQIEDDNLGMYSGMIIPQLAAATKKHPDGLLKTLIQANPLGFDGKALFADDHPVYNKAGDTYDNNFPSTALSADNFNTTWAKMVQYKGEDDQLLGIMPTHLIVPPQLKKTAMEILQADLVAGASGGFSNVLKGWAQIMVIPELANESTTWYLADLSKPLKPFGFQVRRAPEFASRDNLQDPKVFEKEKFTYGVSYRGEVFHTLPFLIAKAVA